MAFSSPFSSTPAFGATTSLFGASSSAASPFAQQSSPSLFGSSPAFGAGSTPLFGASSAAFGGFGATSTPAFGSSSAGASTAASTPSLFGTPAPSTGAVSLFSPPAFGAAQSQPAFGSTLFGGAGQQQQQQPGLFGLQPQQHQNQQSQAQGPQLQSSSAALVTKDGKPLSHSTKWEDISPQGQAYLLELEKTIMTTREQCRQLENCERLRQAAGRQAMEEVQQDMRVMRQGLQYLQMLVKADLEEVASFREKALHLTHDTEQAVFTFKRTQRWRDAAKAVPGAALPPNLREQLAGPIVLPSAYLRRAVASFQETVQQYKLLVSELEAVLPATPLQRWADASGPAGNGAAADPLRALPAAVQNLHDYLIHVAARLERLHEAVDRAKDAFLAAMRQSGDLHDPFAAAERREQQRKNAAKERVTSIPPAGFGQTAPGAATVTSAAAGGVPAGTGSLFGGAPASSPFNTALVPATAGATGFTRAGSVSAAPQTRKTKAKSGRA